MRSFKVTISIMNNDPKYVGEVCYLTGNFNKWQTNSTVGGEIPPVGTCVDVVLDQVGEGLLEFKLTRGDWSTLACSVEGKLGEPFSVHVDKDVNVSVAIDAWRDSFPLSTASSQVHILDDSFYFSNLDLHRRIWIYLPEGYGSNERRYPVLYMHDGQHVFDEATAVGRLGPIEWCVDEVIDEAEQKAIVVAIDHATDFKGREREYLVNPTSGQPKVFGEAYLRDITAVLKPYVDAHYRTLSDRKNTALLGSSLGGLLNIYGGLLYPDIFGAVGVFSPSIWMDREGVYTQLDDANQHAWSPLQEQSYYFYCGGMEIRKHRDGIEISMVDDMESFIDQLKQISYIHVDKYIDPQGKHGALYWQREFPRFYAWWQEQMNT